MVGISEETLEVVGTVIKLAIQYLWATQNRDNLSLAMGKAELGKGEAGGWNSKSDILSGLKCRQSEIKTRAIRKAVKI